MKGSRDNRDERSDDAVKYKGKFQGKKNKKTCGPESRQLGLFREQLQVRLYRSGLQPSWFWLP